MTKQSTTPVVLLDGKGIMCSSRIAAGFYGKTKTMIEQLITGNIDSDS